MKPLAESGERATEEDCNSTRIARVVGPVARDDPSYESTLLNRSSEVQKKATGQWLQTPCGKLSYRS